MKKPSSFPRGSLSCNPLANKAVFPARQFLQSWKMASPKMAKHGKSDTRAYDSRVKYIMDDTPIRQNRKK